MAISLPTRGLPLRSWPTRSIPLALALASQGINVLRATITARRYACVETVGRWSATEVPGRYKEVEVPGRYTVTEDVLGEV